MQVSAPVPTTFKTPTIPQDLETRLAAVTGLFNRFYANLATTICCSGEELAYVETLLASALVEAHTLTVSKAIHPGAGPASRVHGVTLMNMVDTPTASAAPAEEALATPRLPDHPYNRAFQAFQALQTRTEPTPSAARETLHTFWQGLLPEELAEQSWREFCLDTLSPQVAEDLFNRLNKPVHLWPRFRMHEIITDDDLEDDPAMGTQLRIPTWPQTISTAEAVRRGKLSPTVFLELVRSRVREHCDNQLWNQLLRRNSALQETFSPTIPSPLVTLPSQPSQF